MQKADKYKVVIVGGGSAGWMTAAALSKVLSPELHQIQLIESKKIGTVSVGEATIPSILEFNQLLGIDEKAFLRFCQGSFKLGIEFKDWGEIGEQYIHPFGQYGLNMNGIAFHHYWLKDKLAGAESKISEYNLEYSAAIQQKFCHPQVNSRSPLASLKYAYHFDATKYADFLADFAINNGVVKLESEVTAVYQHPDNSIKSVELSDKRQIEGDFFIDCSGFKALLIAQTLNVTYEDWRSFLPCDSAIAQASEPLEDFKPYTISHAHQNGWQWQIPLQHRVGNGYVYSSQFLDEDDARNEFSKRLPSKALNDAKHLKWVNGKRKQAWNKNCVAIGLSQGFIEPLESTGLHLIQSAITKLISLFPSKQIYQADVDAFNRYTDDEIYRIRDFVILHYKLNRREDSAFWQYCQEMEIPDSLQMKIELYKANGRIFRDNNELFSEISWFSVLNGQGITPLGYHPLVDTMPEVQREKNLTHIKGAMRETVAQMPSHKEYLRHYCKQ